MEHKGCSEQPHRIAYRLGGSIGLLFRVPLFLCSKTGEIKMKNIKNEKICAICYRQIAPSENVAHRVNQIEEEVSNVCCMDCFYQMEEVHDDHC